MCPAPLSYSEKTTTTFGGQLHLAGFSVSVH